MNERQEEEKTRKKMVQCRRRFLGQLDWIFGAGWGKKLRKSHTSTLSVIRQQSESVVFVAWDGFYQASLYSHSHLSLCAFETQHSDEEQNVCVCVRERESETQR